MAEGGAHGGRAVLLVGFGSPAGGREVRPFIREILSDHAVSPFAGWGALMRPAATALSFLAAARSRRWYRSLAPGLSSADAVGDLMAGLAAKLCESGRCDELVVAMRYGAPSIAGALRRIADSGVDEVVVLPLFPHQALSTTGSIEAEVARLCRTSPLSRLAVRFAGGWFKQSGFADAWAGAILRALESFPPDSRRSAHLIFSAHAIPLAHVERGDIYVWQIEESASHVSDALGGGHSYDIAWQSAPRHGRWTRPALADALRFAGARGIRDALIVPISFAYDNIETWRDIDMDILPQAGRFGIERLARAAPPATSPRMLDAIAADLR